jgi:hypothetical protein
MRFNFRIKIGTVTFFTMMATTQKLDGTSSLQNDGNHIIYWDIENCTLNQAENTLKNVQRKYGLSHIYVVSDAENSYRAWCLSKVTFQTLMSILTDSLQILDYNFYYYTVKRRKATLRTAKKKDRPSQKVISVLPSYFAEIPKRMEHVIYDTGTEKRGFSILLGDRDG